MRRTMWLRKVCIVPTLPTMLAANILGEAHSCPCGGVTLKVAGTTIHIAAQDVTSFVHLTQGIAGHATASPYTPDHAAKPGKAVPVAEMTPTEQARFGAEGPIRPRHARPCNRTLH